MTIARACSAGRAVVGARRSATARRGLARTSTGPGPRRRPAVGLRVQRRRRSRSAAPAGSGAVSLCSAVSTWSSCTGVGGLRDRDRVAVVERRRRRRARAAGRRRSCPRGRCAGGSSASRPCGSAGPLSSISIVTTDAVRARLALDRRDLADVDAGDPHRRVRADVVRVWKTALKLEAVRERDVLGEAEVDDDASTIEHERADRRALAARSLRGDAARGCGVAPRELTAPVALVSSSACPGCPATLPITGLAGAGRPRCRPRTPGLARRRRCSGTGSRAGSCRASGPLAGADDGPPSLLGPCGVGDDDEPQPGAVACRRR